jgi:hypothetical protein
MAASSKLRIMEAERRFPIRIRIGVPLEGLGGRVDQMRAWLDGNCGANGWAITPSGMRGVLNDALSIYFLDPTLASAFVARWCAGYMVETAEGVFRVRDDEPTPRGGAASDALSGLYPADRRRRGAHQGHPLWHEHLELDGLRSNGAHP